LKMEKNELMIQSTKDIDEERNVKRILQTEIERLQFKMQTCNEEN